MEEDLNKNIQFKERVSIFINKNKTRLIWILSIVFIAIALVIFNDINNKKKNRIISEKYIQAGLYLASNDNNKSKQLFEEIILSKNSFYSPLALNVLLEKSLENDHNKIMDHFKIVESIIKSKERKDLISFKKALYLIKNSKIDDGKKILNELVKNESQLKFLAEEILQN